MNTTISRIAAAAPVAIAVLGFGIGSAHAAPYDPSSVDKVQIQPAGDPPVYPDFPVSDDLPDVGPVDPGDVGPADPADEPADEPTEDDSDDEESDEDTDTDTDTEGSTSGGGSSNGSSDSSSTGSDNGADSDEAEQAPTEAAGVQVTPLSASGVQVAPGLVAAASAALAGVVAWAAYRRTKVTA